MYDFDIYYKIENREHFSAGPSEFLDLIHGADFVYTDSFHALAFCVNFNKKFYVFDRNYGVASPQSSRIVSIIDLFDMKDAYITSDTEQVLDFEYDNTKVNKILEDLREKSFEFFKKSLEEISDESCFDGTFR